MNVSPDKIFSILSNQTRLRCLMMLLAYEELCVCDFTDVIGAAQPNVSRYLAQLRDIGFLLDRHDSRWTYYRMNPELPVWVKEILNTTYDSVARREPYQSDLLMKHTFAGNEDKTQCA